MSPLEKLASMELYGDCNSGEWDHNVVDAPPTPPTRCYKSDNEVMEVNPPAVSMPAPDSGVLNNQQAACR